MRHHLDSTKKQFIGKTLTALTRSGDASAIAEFGDGTKVEISVTGDCCSHSVFYEIEMPDSLVGSTLEDIVEHTYEGNSDSELTADDEATALEKVKASGIDFSPEDNSIWNVVLKTNRGNALLRHINASNGYYDGYTDYTWVV